ncbi:MAG TPA: VWA domain-containing protein [Bryobacteraceae bacterium]|nr:VWA domain-containing protein [Bryobacteraceae bacterium]HPT28787.1 VWA domain-containing protein [Bryobacteraceae bacterium]
MFIRLILLSSLTVAAWSQTQAPAPAAATSQEAFKSAVTEVIVPVTVTDEKGKFISNLDPKNFKLYDEGIEQTISFFTRERNQPVVIGYLIDLSNTNKLHWDKFKEALIELISATMDPDGKGTLRDQFSGYLVGYSTDAELMVNTTNDPEKLISRIGKVKPGGGAALFDALYMACTSRTLIKGEPIEPRRVIVVVGDGHDNSSKKGLNEIVELAQRNLVTIYGVSTVAFGSNAVGESNLKRLADATGGRVVYPLNDVYSDVAGYLSTPSDEGNYALKVGTGGYAAQIMSGIVRAIGATAGEITTQYILRYTPSDTDRARAFRRIEVRVNIPYVKVRAREGYYPFPVQ